jgi:hypothetical protein
MPQRFPLAANAVVASDGTATATIVAPAHGRFTAKQITVSVSATGTTSSQAQLYRNIVHPSTYVDGTNSGDFNTDTQPALEFETTETVICYWTGAVAGATAYLRIIADYEPF